MKPKIDTISEKITLLNETILESMVGKNDKEEIIKNFTEVGIKILEADYGFAWWRSNEDKEYRLAYRSSTTPYDPPLPRKNAGNYIARKTKKPFFDSNVRPSSYEFNIEKFLTSYIIIPIFYNDFMYGNLVFCYQKKRLFSKDEITLSNTIGNVAAQAITINMFIENERKTILIAEKQKESEILLAQEKLKAEFIANATHELRTPLAIMQGSIDLALMDKANAKLTKETFSTIGTEIRILSNILNDLTLLTSSEKSLASVISIESVDINNLIEIAIKRMETTANAKKITIKKRKTPKNPLFIKGDKRYIDKLIINILKNAISYGKVGGHIYIDTLKKKDRVAISIFDDGIGIPKNDLPKIFERFFRVDKAHTSKNHSGLGLAIAKWIAEAHNGSISVKSTLGQGSCFTIYLPAGLNNHKAI